MPKHVHAELIHAWADGAEIQHLVSYSNVDKWVDCVDFDWLPHVKYRLKPKPKTIKYKRYIAKFPPADPILGFYTSDFKNLAWPPNLPRGYEITDWLDTEWQEVEVPE